MHDQEHNMNAGLSEPGVGVSAFLLCMTILFTMMEKGLFSPDETHSILDTALNTLKSDRETDKTLPEATVVSAIELLENIRQGLTAQ
tara:strand:- start:3623 stop:3883 length:261 start_codon:yes stop_codon:yes gene_type:complete